MAGEGVTKCKGCGVEFNDKDISGMVNCPVCGKGFFETQNEKTILIIQPEVKTFDAKKVKESLKNFIYAIIILTVIGAFISPKEERRPSSAVNIKSYEAKNDGCGSVSNSGWDGSVYQVERYLKRHLKDPSSFEAVSWSKVIGDGYGNCKVRCNFRAKNSFGGYVVESKVFTLTKSGEVVSVND